MYIISTAKNRYSATFMHTLYSEMKNHPEAIFELQSGAGIGIETLHVSSSSGYIEHLIREELDVVLEAFKEDNVVFEVRTERSNVFSSIYEDCEYCNFEGAVREITRRRGVLDKNEASVALRVAYKNMNGKGLFFSCDDEMVDRLVDHLVIGKPFMKPKDIPVYSTPRSTTTVYEKFTTPDGKVDLEKYFVQNELNTVLLELDSAGGSNDVSTLQRVISSVRAKIEAVQQIVNK